MDKNGQINLVESENEIPIFRRSICKIDDLSLEERIYFYNYVRKIKQDALRREDLSKYLIERKTPQELKANLVFLEDSTRTDQSFQNALMFHSIPYSDFDVNRSSFNKSETYYDTFKTLMGYGSSIFVVRSKVEGLCRWLDNSLTSYASDFSINTGQQMPKPLFINAGDGMHEHPTQELLDEYSFLEQFNFNNQEIHIALIGDLRHGRTVHSKVDGLKIFEKVKVDLIAPPEIGMPKDYIEKMKQLGYEINEFESLNEYLSQKDKSSIAPIFYFTRLQKERMDEETQKKISRFEKQLSISEENIIMVPYYTRLYHPLPRDKNYIMISRFLDKTPFNRYDEQSQNGYFTRIGLLSMLLGYFDQELVGKRKREQVFIDDFVNEATILPKKSNKPEYRKAIRPIEDGIVIDHIARGEKPSDIWEIITRIRKSLKLDSIGSQGVFTSTPVDGVDYYKGIISIHGYNISGAEDDFVRKLSAISPNCTLNIIEGSKITKKYRLGMPQAVIGFDGTSCKNPNCISYPAYNEGVTPSFHSNNTNGAKQFICDYCDTPHEYSTIFDPK